MIKRSFATVALVLAVAIVIAHARVVLLGDTWDDVAYHTEVAPARLAAAHAVARGEAPAWWEASGLGEPLLGEPSHAALDPPTWLARTPRALDLVMVLHLWWVALGVAALARKQNASDLASLAAGLLVGASGILASTALRGALPAVAQLPWLALAAGQIGKSRWAPVGLAATIAAIGLAGELAILFDGVLVAIGLSRGAWRQLVVALAGGLAIGGLQWIPAVFALPDAAGATVHGLPLSRMLELIVPGSFGGDHGVAAVAGTTPWLPSLYVGVPLLALARPRGRLVAPLIAITVLVFAAGRGGWPRWLGAPELHLAALVALVGASVASGLDALLAGERRVVLGLGAAALVLAIALVALAIRTTGVDRALLDGGLAAASAAGAAALAYVGVRRSSLKTAIVVALLVAPSLGSLASTAPVIDRAIVDSPPLWARAIGGPWPRRTYRPPDKPASLDDAMGTLAGESGYWWGIGTLRSESPARPPALDKMFLASGHDGGAALARYGAGFPILPTGHVQGEGIPTLAEPRGDLVLASYPTAPAASVALGWKFAHSDEAAFGLLFSSTGKSKFPIGSIVVDGIGESNDDRRPPVPCQIQRWEDGDIRLACRTRDPGYAVVSSAAADGWTVTVDGQDQPWLAADVLRRAVKLTDGSHDLVWTYRAPGWTLAWIVGLVGLALTAASGRRGRSSPSSP